MTTPYPHPSFGRVRSHAEQIRGLIDDASRGGPNGTIYRALVTSRGVMAVLTLVCANGQAPVAYVTSPFNSPHAPPSACLRIPYSAPEELAVFFGLANAPLPTLPWVAMPLNHPHVTFYQHTPPPDDLEEDEENPYAETRGWNADTEPVETMPLPTHQPGAS